MTGPSRKRQKREDYRQAQENAAKSTNGQSGTKIELPKKKFYRQRAHANPFSDHNLTYPATPKHMDWTTHYPAFAPQMTDENGQQSKPMTKNVEIADIGCGFGGLLVALSPLFPDTLMVGMELRTQVLSYVRSRISALRSQHSTSIKPAIGTLSTNNPASTSTSASTVASQPPAEVTSDVPHPTAPSTVPQPSEPPTTPHPPPTSQSHPEPEPTSSSHHPLPSPPNDLSGPYQNISALRTNTMKFLPNYFPRATLSSIFICFPDPHFKTRKHKARIVSATLNAEYAFVLRPGGCVYTVTDVEELHLWIVRHFEGLEAGRGRELWDRVVVGEHAAITEGIGAMGVGEKAVDREVAECIRVMCGETEEAKKVRRNGGRMFVGVWRRREDPDWIEE